MTVPPESAEPAAPAVVSGPPRHNAGAARVVTIGVFDGVHQGHRHLLREARAEADTRGLELAVLTFDPHPMCVVRPSAAPPMLATLAQRIRLLAGAGADLVRVATFDQAMAAMSARDFVDVYLTGDLRAAAVVTGENFRFGHRAAGDVELLAVMGRDNGFAVTAVPLHGDASSAWSSSRIRSLVAAGDVGTAAEGLTRWYRVEGTVVPGDGRGRGLGFPTANVAPPANSCRPGDGVYAAWLTLEPYERNPVTVAAAVSVGANATFDGRESRIEAHVIDGGQWDLYDRYVALDFVRRIRDMEAFGSVADLQRAMTGDVATAQRILSG